MSGVVRIGRRHRPVSTIHSCQSAALAGTGTLAAA